MYPWWLEFHENIKFSKTHSEYQEQPYLQEKATIVFFDLPKKCICRTFMEHSENISVFNIVGALYGNIHMGIFIILEHYMGIL